MRVWWPRKAYRSFYKRFYVVEGYWEVIVSDEYAIHK